MARRRPSPQAAVAVVLVGVAGGAWWLARDQREDDANAPYVTVVQHESSTPAATTTSLPPLRGRRLPTVTLAALDGAERTTDELVGRPLVVNFWFATCLPCRTEMPAIDAVARDLDGRLDIVGVDPFDDAAGVRSFVDEVGVGYEQLLDTDGALVSELGITSFPATVLVAADGTISSVHLGPLDDSELRRLLGDEFGIG